MSQWAGSEVTGGRGQGKRQRTHGEYGSVGELLERVEVVHSAVRNFEA